MVKAWWAEQPFQLGLAPHQDNCDLCWKKADWKLDRIIRDEPERAEWWARMERSVDQDQSGSRFVLNESVAQRADRVARTPMFDLPVPNDADADEHECMWDCATEAEMLPGFGEAA